MNQNAYKTPESLLDDCNRKKESVITNFLYGDLSKLNLPTYKWWKSKWLEYNTKLIACLFINQVLLYCYGFISGLITFANTPEKVVSSIIALSGIIVLANLFYILWPTVDFLIFRKVSRSFRKFWFSCLNVLSLVPLLLSISVLLFS